MQFLLFLVKNVLNLYLRELLVRDLLQKDDIISMFFFFIERTSHNHLLWILQKTQLKNLKMLARPFQVGTHFDPGLPTQKHPFKDVRAKNFYNMDFFILWLQSDNELPMSEMEKNWGVTDFVFEIKRVKNYPDFDKSALVT